MLDSINDTGILYCKYPLKKGVFNVIPCLEKYGLQKQVPTVFFGSKRKLGIQQTTIQMPCNDLSDQNPCLLVMKPSVDLYSSYLRPDFFLLVDLRTLLL